MRKFLTISFITFGLTTLSFGQEVIRMTLSQPPALQVLAGHDTLVCKGHPVILGGIPTAQGGSGDYLYIWSPPDGLDDPTSANPVSTLMESRSYMLTVIDAQGCQSVGFVSVYIDQCLGVNDQALPSSLSIFPNPNDGKFRITGLGTFASRLLNICILNQLGQTLYSREFGQDPISQDLEIDAGLKLPGVYFIRLSFSDRVLSQRLIVR